MTSAVQTPAILQQNKGLNLKTHKGLTFETRGLKMLLYVRPHMRLLH